MTWVYSISNEPSYEDNKYHKITNSLKNKNNYLQINPDFVPPEIEEEIRCELEIDGLDERQSQDGDVDVD